MDSSNSITSDETENEIEDDNQSPQSVSKRKEIPKSANSSSKASKTKMKYIIREASARSMEKQVGNKGITWVIKNFSSIKSETIYSDQFVVDGCKWRLEAYPNGYKIDDHLSLFLDVPDKAFLPIGWRRHAKFSLTLVNQFSEKLSLVEETQHLFDQKSSEWGFPEMISPTELQAKEGVLKNGDLIVVAKIELLEVVHKSDVSEESSLVIDVNGFQVLPSQVDSVKRLFERHPDIASNFLPENPYLKTAYMNVLLSLTQMLCQSPQELSKSDISDADAALAYLRIAAGFNLDWLEKKLDELKEKKKKEEASLTQLQELEEKLKPFKKQCLDLEAQIDNKKTELLAARAPLSLYEDRSLRVMVRQRLARR